MSASDVLHPAQFNPYVPRHAKASSGGVAASCPTCGKYWGSNIPRKSDSCPTCKTPLTIKR